MKEALALALAPQEIRTFFVSFATFERRFLLQSDRVCDLLLDVIRVNRKQGRVNVHGFVFMPNQVHLLITPAANVSLEKALQFIKGGFSYRAHKELGMRGAIWNPGFNEHRIRDDVEFAAHLRYTHMNAVKAGRVGRSEDWPYSSARLMDEIDVAPAVSNACAKAHLIVKGRLSPA